MLTQPLSRHSPATITDIEQLEKELERVRERGFASANHEIETGASAFGAALRTFQGTPVGAISLGGPTNRFTPRQAESLARELMIIAEYLTPFIPSMD